MRDELRPASASLARFLAAVIRRQSSRARRAHFPSVGDAGDNVADARFKHGCDPIAERPAAVV